MLSSVIGQMLGPLQAVAVAIFYGALLVATVQWAIQFDSADILTNFRRVMRINIFTSLGFLAFLLLHLFLLPLP